MRTTTKTGDSSSCSPKYRNSAPRTIERARAEPGLSEAAKEVFRVDEGTLGHLVSDVPVKPGFGNFSHSLKTDPLPKVPRQPRLRGCGCGTYMWKAMAYRSEVFR